MSSCRIIKKKSGNVSLLDEVILLQELSQVPYKVFCIEGLTVNPINTWYGSKKKIGGNFWFMVIQPQYRIQNGSYFSYLWLFLWKIEKNEKCNLSWTKKFSSKNIVISNISFCTTVTICSDTKLCQKQIFNFFCGGRGSFLVQNGRFFIILPIFQRIHYI